VQKPHPVLYVKQYQDVDDMFNPASPFSSQTVTSEYALTESNLGPLSTSQLQPTRLLLLPSVLLLQLLLQLLLLLLLLLLLFVVVARSLYDVAALRCRPSASANSVHW
jgi:hypothetical protein